LCGTARAQESDVPTTSERARRFDAGGAVREGLFLPSTLAARVGATPAYVSAFGGYDTAGRAPIAATTVEVQLWGPIAIRGGAQYSASREGARPSFGGRAQLLRQERHGVDGAVSVFYRPEGFTEPEGEIETFVSLGRRFGRATVIGNLVYGQDPEGNERDGEVRAAAQVGMGRWTLGAEARARFALGAQHGAQAKAEPTFDLLAGPVAAATLGSIAIFAGAGPTLLRAGGTSTLGVTGLAGLGAVY
jgi:hypothetical protein